MPGSVITIDGPAGSGKSTLAKDLASSLGYLYLNTGAMYRALTVRVLEKNIDTENATACADVLKDMRFRIEKKGRETVLLLDGSPLPESIRSALVDRNVSTVSKHGAVRDIMADKQRELGRKGFIIAEGRDAGTRIFPDSPLKLYITASLEERAKRRFREYQEKGAGGMSLQGIEEDMRKRDALDSSRTHSPLTAAHDAVVIDTTGLTREGQKEKALSLVRERQLS